MNPLILIALIIHGVTINLDRVTDVPMSRYLAWEQVWDDGTLIAAHNWLAGLEFANVDKGDIVRGVYMDGSIVNFEVAETGIYYLSDNNWEQTIRRYSAKDHITLATCYHEDGRLLIELQPRQNDKANQR